MIMNKTILLIFGVSIFLVIAIGLSFQHDGDPVPPDSIICFGDSITEGYRMSEQSSFPYFLGQILGESVVNAGISGETSQEGLKRIKRDVLVRQPYLVLIQFGGNDFYQNIDPEITFANLDQMIHLIQDSGANAVLLIGAPMMLQPVYLEGFRELARNREIYLIENAINEISRNSLLRLDDIHPNRKGNKELAEAIARYLTENQLLKTERKHN